MILAIHQPQYLPWLGYFYKMSLADLFIILDHAQYAKNKVQNRNYIRSHDGPLTLTVPVLSRGHSYDPIREIQIDNKQPWARRHWTWIEQAYRRYPYFLDYAGELEATYARTWKWLVDLNLHLTNLLMHWLCVEVPTRRSSEFDFSGHKTELLVEICKTVGADTHISGQGATAFIEPERFREAGIRLLFCEFRHPVYYQYEQPFVPELSALDVVMNLGPNSKEVIAKAKQISDIKEWVAMDSQCEKS